MLPAAGGERQVSQQGEKALQKGPTGLAKGRQGTVAAQVSRPSKAEQRLGGTAGETQEGASRVRACGK